MYFFLKSIKKFFTKDNQCILVAKFLQKNFFRLKKTLLFRENFLYFFEFLKLTNFILFLTKKVLVFITYFKYFLNLVDGVCFLPYFINNYFGIFA